MIHTIEKKISINKELRSKIEWLVLLVIVNQR